MSESDNVLEMLYGMGVVPSPSGVMSSGNVLCHCPFHIDNDASLSFHVGKLVWNCKSCGNRGTLKALCDWLGKGDPNWQPDPIFQRQLNARRELDATFQGLNRAIRDAPAPDHVKEWLWDRLDQFRGLLPSPNRGAHLGAFDDFTLSLAMETLDVQRILGLCAQSQYDLDTLISGVYYRRRWAVRES